MRVLHLYSGNLYGGIETLLVTLARQQSSEIEQVFGVCFEGRLSNELRGSGAQVHNLGAVRLSRPWTVWGARRRIAKLLRRERFDAVICHSSWPTVVFGPAVTASAGPLVLWLHDRVDARDRLQRLASRTLPGRIICNSHYTAATVRELYPDVPSAVVYCAVEPPLQPLAVGERDSIRAELHTQPDAVVIVQASRMEEWKGQVLHLRTLAELKDLPDWVCWMIGGAQRPAERAFESRLLAIAGEFGLKDRIRFAGQRSDVPRLLAAADIYFQPNTGPEPFGIALVEALYAGLPVVTTALGGAVEIVTDRCGTLIADAGPTELARALRVLVQDRDERARRAAVAPARARELCEPRQQLTLLAHVLGTTDSIRECAGEPGEIVASIAQPTSRE